MTRSVCCHRLIGSLAWYSRISGTSGTGLRVVPVLMISGIISGAGDPAAGWPVLVLMGDPLLGQVWARGRPGGKIRIGPESGRPARGSGGLTARAGLE